MTSDAPPPLAPPTPSPEWPTVVWMVVIGVVAMLPFLPTLWGDWVIDDVYNIVENRHVRDWSSVLRAFYSSDINSNDSFYHYPTWRPLRHVAFVVDFHLAGMTPAWFRGMNLLLHGVAAGLAFALFRSLGATNTACLVGVLACFWHPVMTESLAQAKERDGLLATAFFLAAALAARQPTRRGVIASTALYACSLLSKESTVAGVVLLGLLVVVWSRQQGDPARRWWATLAAWVGATVAFVLVRHAILGRSSQSAPLGESYLGTLWTMGEVFARYLALVVWPFELPIVFDDITQRPLLSPAVWLGFVLLGSIVAAVALLWSRRPLLAVGLAWFVVALLPLSNIVPLMLWMAVRFLAFPMIGLGLVAAGAWMMAQEHAWARRAMLGGRATVAGLAAAVVLAGLALVSTARIVEWRNEDTIWAAEFRIKPNTIQARVGIARVLIRENKPAEAVAIIDTFRAQHSTRPPGEWEATTRSAALMQMGRDAEALAYIDTLAPTLPFSPRLAMNQGVALWNLRRPREAVAVWEALAARNPADPGPWRRLEAAYAALGRAEDLDRVRKRQVQAPRTPDTPAPTAS